MRLKQTVLAIAVAGFAACDDPFEAFLGRVPDEPGEAVLTDLLNGPLGEPAAFDVIVAIPIRVELTNQWDFAYVLTSQGESQLAPFTAVTDSVSSAGIQRVTESFEGVLEAPTQGYQLDEPLSVQSGDVFVVRSRQDPTTRIQCRRFAKIEILDIQVIGGAGTLTFRFLANPNCEDIVLVPGERGNF